VRWQVFQRERCAARQLQPSGNRPGRHPHRPSSAEEFAPRLRSVPGGRSIRCEWPESGRLPGRCQAPGGMVGPLRVVNRGKGGKGPAPGVGPRRPPSGQRSGRRTGAGTRTRRRPRLSRPCLEQRTAAAPPSTKLPHSNQKKIMSNSWFMCGATFRWLVLVPFEPTPFLVSTHSGLGGRAKRFWPHPNVSCLRSSGPRIKDYRFLVRFHRPRPPDRRQRTHSPFPTGQGGSVRSFIRRSRSTG
jgi:hypothetical protein